MRQICKTILCLYILVICIVFVYMIEEKTNSNANGKASFKNSSITRDGKMPGGFIEYSQEDITVQKWRMNDVVARKMSVTMFNKILPYVTNGSKDLDLSPACSRALMKTLVGLKQYKVFAFQMVDSSGMLPSGMLSNNINSLGNYDECLGVNLPGSFRGQYCSLNVFLPLPERERFRKLEERLPEFEDFYRSVSEDSVTAELLRRQRFFYFSPFQAAACVPSTCTKEEVQKIAKSVVQSFEINADVVVPYCDLQGDKREFGYLEIVIITVLGILLFLGISSTVVDVYLNLTTEEENYQCNLSLPTKYFLCFSFYANTLRLLAPDNSTDSIKVFHGLRVFSILWIILGHTYGFQVLNVSSSATNLYQYSKEISFQVILQGFMAVDTFFFMSSVVHSYGITKLKDLKINYGLHILRRILRLGIPFTFVMSCVFLIPYLGSGPVWNETIDSRLVANCRSNWWTNLLFIGNFVPYEEKCLDWFWYIPVDTQLFLLSLLVVIPMRRNPRIAFAITLFLLLGGICLSEALRLYYGLTKIPIHGYANVLDFHYSLEIEYHRPYEHIPCCCIGLAVGYFLATRSFKMKIPLKINVALWLAAITLGLTVVYGMYDWNQGNIPNIFVCMLYKSTKRLWWSLALAWVTISCTTGNGGIINTFLSWPVFLPLGRLTYMVYLIHPIILYIYLGSTRTLIEIDHRSLTYMYIGHVVLSYMFAFGLGLLFESPFLAIQKLVFSKFIPEDVKRLMTSNSAKKEMEEVTKMCLSDHEDTEKDRYPVMKEEMKANVYGTMGYRKFK